VTVDPHHEQLADLLRNVIRGDQRAECLVVGAGGAADGEDAVTPMVAGENGSWRHVRSFRRCSAEGNFRDFTISGKFLPVKGAHSNA